MSGHGTPGENISVKNLMHLIALDCTYPVGSGSLVLKKCVRVTGDLEENSLVFPLSPLPFSSH